MKQAIETKLWELFPDKGIEVLALYNRYGEEITEWMDGVKPANTLHRVLVFYSGNKNTRITLIDPQGVYFNNTEEAPKKVLVFEFKGLTFHKYKPASKEEKDNVRKMQFACGFKKTEAIALKETPYNTIKKYFPQLADIYKMLADLAKDELLSGQFEKGMLYIHSMNGKYCVPAENIDPKCSDRVLMQPFIDLFHPELLKGNPFVNFQLSSHE